MGGGSNTQSSQQQTQQNTVDPAEMALYQQNYATAQQNAGSLTPYTGQITAGFNPTQTQAQGILSNVANDPSYAAANNNAIGSVQGILANPTNPTISPTAVNPSTVNPTTYNPTSYSASTYNPTSYSASTYNPSTATAATYNPAQLANTNLSPYMNPFTSSVINASVNQNELARQAANVNDNEQATAAGAFGGSRSGVANAITNQLYDQNDQTNIANLNSANYSQAQAAALADIGAQNQAGQYNATNEQNTSLANAGILNSAGQFNAANTQNAAAANASAANTSDQYNASNTQNAAAANASAANTANQYDASNAQNAAQFNSTQGLTASQFNSGQDVAAQQATFNNALAAQGLTINAAGQVVALNNANLQTAATQGGILGAVGDAQQSQQQTELTNAYNAYMQGQQLTVEQQQLLNSALGLVPIQQTVTGSGSGNSSTQTSPGIGGILGGAGSLVSGLAML